MQLILNKAYKDSYKKFLTRHKVKNIGRYMDALETSYMTVFANIDKKEITSIIVVNLIDNIYYIEDLIYDDNFIEVGILLRYLIDYFKREELGIKIVYDNYPYDMNTASILLSCSFKCQSIDYEFNAYDKTALIRRNMEINLKSEAVKKYIYDKFMEVQKSNDLYFDEYEINRHFNINLDHTNTLVSIENDIILGALRFSVINDSIRINDLYAESVDIYVDLVNVIKNLTNKMIEITVYPTRRDLIEALNILKFEIRNSDFVYKL